LCIYVNKVKGENVRGRKWEAFSLPFLKFTQIITPIVESMQFVII